MQRSHLGIYKIHPKGSQSKRQYLVLSSFLQCLKKILLLESVLYVFE
ncbi:hypothetical protein [uncultured Gammaproteobacteria bacterium]|nr:hypothetical protein [uncultured Gammaproteobacteria bacterium]VVH59850.1 hypothetical protein BSPCLSOX_1159 [uncultured Gammaproteobacteria bacterium]VVH61701.1 hypothetical protein BSPWISOX_933 [uncultured Gammaproteobacteria bacterium]